ncbi:diadenylate cyclase domain-containing protein [Domibacillus tundrae]|uniref:diadenylate cyclase domain-containing protein n=1 Tax=Domibacillus tundrae TaxID=1587527 RepID=UPI0033932EA8
MHERKKLRLFTIRTTINKRLEDTSFDINEGIKTLKNDSYCVLGKLEDLKDKFEKAETMVASFYLNCYLSPFNDK